MTSFGKALKNLRLEKQLTQHELGKTLGVSQRVISFWENGNAEPDLETVLKIAKYFNVTIEEMLNDRY